MDRMGRMGRIFHPQSPAFAGAGSNLPPSRGKGLRGIYVLLHTPMIGADVWVVKVNPANVVYRIRPEIRTVPHRGACKEGTF